jgi:hypothetical protein
MKFVMVIIIVIIIMPTCTVMLSKSMTWKAVGGIGKAYIEYSALLLGYALTAGKNMSTRSNIRKYRIYW